MKRHAALVLGNVSQTDAHRAAAGEAGAVEALFSLCDTDDGVVRANALWALGNLAWDPRNQVHARTRVKPAKYVDICLASGYSRAVWQYVS